MVVFGTHRFAGIQGTRVLFFFNMRITEWELLQNSKMWRVLFYIMFEGFWYNKYHGYGYGYLTIHLFECKDTSK